MPAIYSPYKDQLQDTEYYDMIEGTELPAEVVEKTAAKYLEAYRMLTGRAL